MARRELTPLEVEIARKLWWVGGTVVLVGLGFVVSSVWLIARDSEGNEGYVLMTLVGLFLSAVGAAILSAPITGRNLRFGTIDASKLGDEARARAAAGLPGPGPELGSELGSGSGSGPPISPPGAIPAGWYPTPDGEHERWHDGSAWTGRTRRRA